MSSPALPDTRKTRIKKYFSLSKSRCGSGALTRWLDLNVTMRPSMIGKRVLRSTKRSPFVSGMNSIPVESAAIPSSLRFLDCQGVYLNFALGSCGLASAPSGSKVNIPSAHRRCPSAKSVIILWKPLIWVFDFGIVLSRGPKMSCWSWSCCSGPQNIYKTFQRSSATFCCVFLKEGGKIWTPLHHSRLDFVIMQHSSYFFVCRWYISNLLLEWD